MLHLIYVNDLLQPSYTLMFSDNTKCFFTNRVLPGQYYVKPDSYEFPVALPQYFMCINIFCNWLQIDLPKMLLCIHSETFRPHQLNLL